ncbi:MULTISPECIES: hypothetical protein [unclassified Saccharothrix]|uniref:hypothetical protein n=1 Tax=unclassified Saccharothrix TaxID=2593673 RepID=UPI00307E025F
MDGFLDRLVWRLREIFDRVPAVSEPVAVVQVPDAADPRGWIALDASARSSTWNAPAWTYTAARRLAAGQAGPLDLLLAACHPNGYVREAVVTALGERDDVTALPMLALRAADWVPEVRDRARRVCAGMLDRAPAEAVTALAPVALALRARQEGRWLAETVENVLRAGPAAALTAALASEDRHTRRLAHTIALDTGRLDVERLVRTARTDPDLPIRVLCAEAAIRSTGDPEVARRLLTSRTASIRAEAVRALAAAGDTDPADRALADRSALVRATAQVALRRAGTDPATRYRALLDQQRPPRPAVIAGLAETGTRTASTARAETAARANSADSAACAEAGARANSADSAARVEAGARADSAETGACADSAALRPWLSHPSSRGRAETVRGLRHLGDTPRDLLLPLLTDPVGSVTRQVVLSLLDQADTLDERSLRALLHRPHPTHVQRAAYRLLCAHGVWTRISVDLHLIGGPEHALRATARADLGNWLRHDATTTYSVPEGPRATELSTLLTQAEPVLGPERTRILRFHLNLT